MDRGFVFGELLYRCNPWPTASRLVPLALLFSLTLIFWVLRRPDAVPAVPRAPRRRAMSLWRNLHPATCTLVSAVAVLVLLYFNHYFDLPHGPDAFALHSAVLIGSDSAYARDAAARGYRGITMAMTVLITLAAIWTTAGLWWQNRSLAYSASITWRVVTPALALAAGLAWLGGTGQFSGFHNAVGNTLLCAAWRRDDTPWMSIVTDAFNVIGFYLPAALEHFHPEQP